MTHSIADQSRALDNSQIFQLIDLKGVFGVFVRDALWSFIAVFAVAKA